MKNNFYKLIQIIVVNYFITIPVANAFQVDIAKKYNDIFSSNILSESDINNYQQAYNFQKQCKWKSANRYILKIKNKTLLGHIYAQKFLHPNCYKSKYLELYYWLKKYNDHPQAKRIYKLAIRRMPQGYKSPNKPSLPLGIESETVNTIKKINIKVQKNFPVVKKPKKEN